MTVLKSEDVPAGCLKDAKDAARRCLIDALITRIDYWEDFRKPPRGLTTEQYMILLKTETNRIMNFLGYEPRYEPGQPLVDVLAEDAKAHP